MEHGGYEHQSHMRAADADREAVVEQLREAATDGRLQMHEFDERMEAAYAAKTFGELVPLTRDLASHHEASTSPVSRRSGEHYASTTAVMSDRQRVGIWNPGDSHRAVSIMGTVTIDLRHQPADTVPTINAFALMGEVIVIVRPETPVDLDAVPIMGDVKFKQKRAYRNLPEVAPCGAAVRVRGTAIMGDILVRRQPLDG